MGHEVEVWVWEKKPDFEGEYHYVNKYGGDDINEGFRVARALKAKGCSCIKIEWRSA